MKLSLGLDMGSHSIKLIELAQDGASFTLMAAGSVPMPPNALASTVPADLEAIAAAVKRLVKDTGAKSKSVQIALPESKVFTRVIEVPALSERELSSAIKWEAEQYIPLPLTEVNLDFTVLRDAHETGTNKMEVLLVAAPKALLDKYLTVLEYAELEPIAAETEVIASSRALARSLVNVKSALIAAIGAQTTDLTILRSGRLAFARSMAAGGDALTRAMMQGLDFTVTQAEEYKKTYGLQKDKLEGKLVNAVKPVMDTITNEMKRSIAFYQEKYKEDHIPLALLTGGASRIPGMITYVAEALGIEVQLGNPWAGVTRDPRFNVLTTEGPNFCVAVGLAMHPQS